MSSRPVLKAAEGDEENYLTHTPFDFPIFNKHQTKESLNPLNSKNSTITSLPATIKSQGEEQNLPNSLIGLIYRLE